MPSHPQINAVQLARLVGLAGAPPIVDVRNDEDFALDPRLIPGSIRRDFAKVATWADAFACRRGRYQLPAWRQAQRRHCRLARR
jgi:hypothetical protein